MTITTTKETLKGKVKINDFLVDDIGLIYRVLGVSPFYLIAEPFPNPDCLGCDVMSYMAMAKEGWAIFKLPIPVETE